jgi:serine/threonine protein kinase
MKLENAFLDSNLTIKVADFGLMKDYNNDVLKTKIGTEGYMAPEINLH